MEKIPIRRIQTTRTEPDHVEGFRIRDVKDVLAGKDMIQELHRHDFYFILALKNGKGEHEIDFTSYKIHDASIFFMRPGQVHRLFLRAGSTGYLMEFSPDFYRPHDTSSRELLRKASNKSLCQLSAKAFRQLHTLLTFISREFAVKQEGYLEVIKANLGIFFIELVRHRKNTTSRHVNPYTLERLETLQELLETHITTHKQVAQYADMLHLTVYQLNAITRAALGKTCSELINGFIILEAKRYLLATSEPVNRIADHLGYEDVSYFIRFFRKHTGHTPAMFRKNSR